MIYYVVAYYLNWLIQSITVMEHHHTRIHIQANAKNCSTMDIQRLNKYSKETEATHHVQSDWSGEIISQLHFWLAPPLHLLIFNSFALPT